MEFFVNTRKVWIWIPALLLTIFFILEKLLNLSVSIFMKWGYYYFPYKVVRNIKRDKAHIIWYSAWNLVGPQEIITMIIIKLYIFEHLRPFFFSCVKQGKSCNDLQLVAACARLGGTWDRLCCKSRLGATSAGGHLARGTGHRGQLLLFWGL